MSWVWKVLLLRVDCTDDIPVNEKACGPMDTACCRVIDDGSKRRQFNISEQNIAIDSKKGFGGGLDNSSESKKISCPGRYLLIFPTDRREKATSMYMYSRC